MRKVCSASFLLVMGINISDYFGQLQKVYKLQTNEKDKMRSFFEQIQKFNNELKKKDAEINEDNDEDRILTKENSSLETLTGYSQANHSYHRGVSPIAVFYPTSTEEVSQMVKICNQFGIPVTAYGSGTNLEGSVVPLKECVMIDFEKMNKIKKFYKEDFQVTVEPGIQWMDLNDEIEKDNLFFPMDPGPGASIGGMINTNCSGTNAVKYGTMKDWVVNLTVVLPDGRIVKTANRAKKSSAGYNLNGLFCGSEGTLGIVTEATIKLAPLIREYAVFNIAFDEIQDAMISCTQIIQAGIQPAALEFLDDEQIKANNASSRSKLLEKQHLLIKVEGSELYRKETINQILEITKKNNGLEPHYAINAKEASELWQLRRRSLWSTQKLRPGSKIYITDVCVPISRLTESIKEVKEDIKKNGIVATIVGHVGDGNYHLFICVDLDNKEEFKKVQELHDRLVTKALSMEGTCTGEHGIGIGKRKYLASEKKIGAHDFMKELKKFIDPKLIFNPDKVLFLDELQQN